MKRSSLKLYQECPKQISKENQYFLKNWRVKKSINNQNNNKFTFYIYVSFKQYFLNLPHFFVDNANKNQ